MAQLAETKSKPQETLGLVWIDCPYSVVSVGLERALEEQARVHAGREAPEDMPSSVILCASGVEGLPESV